MPREALLKYNGYTIKWLGWRTPSSTIQVIGIWIAKPSDKSKLYAYSTTAGVAGFVEYGYSLDLSTQPLGFALDVFSYKVERERAKHWALSLITELIDGLNGKYKNVPEGSQADSGESNEG
jgi:hypothetical protein